MANTSFTRDEAILALDVLYSYGNQRLNAQSPVIVELSEILNRLPIHRLEDRRKTFRNPSGVLNQMISFRRSYEKGKKDVNVGIIFYDVALEFSDRLDELHDIASAIRRNVSSYGEIPFGSIYEEDTFPEGILLGHLHRIIEKRDSAKLIVGERCDICKIKTSEIYQGCSNLLTLHLTVPVTMLDWTTRYSVQDYVTVCPNCHAALHQRRPWLTKECCEKIIY